MVSQYYPYVVDDCRSSSVGSNGGERQAYRPAFFFTFRQRRQRERFHLPAFRRAVHHLPVAVDEHIMEAHLFSAFSGNSLLKERYSRAHCPSGNHCHVRNKPSHRPPPLKRMPGGFVTTGPEATDITVFNCGFGLLTGGIVSMQDATVPAGSRRWQ